MECSFCGEEVTLCENSVATFTDRPGDGWSLRESYVYCPKCLTPILISREVRERCECEDVVDSGAEVVSISGSSEFWKRCFDVAVLEDCDIDTLITKVMKRYCDRKLKNVGK